MQATDTDTQAGRRTSIPRQTDKTDRKTRVLLLFAPLSPSLLQNLQTPPIPTTAAGLTADVAVLLGGLLVHLHGLDAVVILRRELLEDQVAVLVGADEVARRELLRRDQSGHGEVDCLPRPGPIAHFSSSKLRQRTRYQVLFMEEVGTREEGAVQTRRRPSGEGQLPLRAILLYINRTPQLFIYPSLTRIFFLPARQREEKN